MFALKIFRFQFSILNFQLYLHGKNLKNIFMKNTFLALFIAGYVLCLYSEPSSKTDSMNPFLNEYRTPYGVPPFDEIKNTDYIPAFEAGIEQQLAEIDAIVQSKKKPNFEMLL